MSVNLALDAVTIAVAAVGGFYAVRSLSLLNRNQDALKMQRGVWLPILYAGGPLVLDRVLAVAADLARSSVPSDALGIAHSLLTAASLALLSLGIFRYWRTQKEYEAEKTGGRPRAVGTA